MVIVYYDSADPQVSFGANEICRVLRGRGVYVLERHIDRIPAEIQAPSLVLSVAPGDLEGDVGEERPQSFAIRPDGAAICVSGSDSTGAMYGALDVAEQLELRWPGEQNPLDGISAKRASPFLDLRGVKFNLPWEPYAKGEPFSANEQICWDLDFWRAYLDMLATNRYNCLTLWSRHPFHLLFRLDKYPQTTMLSDAELERNMRFFRQLFSHAADRGIATYMITWCVDIIPQVVKGLGLPPHFADPRTSHAVRQESEVIKDYFRECVKTLLRTYPELTGLGTSGSEEMVGDAWVRERWVAETYLQGVKQSGRVVPFIHRTNQQSGQPVKDLFIDHYPGPAYISWKYSNAHMYSHPRPQFAELWGAWEGIDLEEVKVTYTVRNDDVHNLRWGDPEYAREYVLGMRKPYVHGYYWGADGYMWGIDFQHKAEGHKRWRYDFERHWYQFALWGRLGYDPELPEHVWKDRFQMRYGQAGALCYEGLKAASKIIPAVNRLFWINYDYQWNPESCLSRFGFKTILDFVDGVSMPSSGVMSIRDYVLVLLEEHRSEGSESQEITPRQIIDQLAWSSQMAQTSADRLRFELMPEQVDGELECVLLDLDAWACLGFYYRYKFEAAVALAVYQETGQEENKADGIQACEQARDWWVKLGDIWARHNRPYYMARVKQMFGWPLHLDQVEQDIELAKSVSPRAR